MTAVSPVNQRVYIVGDTFTGEESSFYIRYGEVFANVLS